MSEVLGALARLENELWAPSSYDAMVLAFLKAEWGRWRLADRGDIRLITEPDLTDPMQNQTKMRLLQTVRGVLLEHIPPDTRWYEVRHLSARHFWQLHNINRSDWSRYSETNELLEIAHLRPERLRQETESWGSWRPILWGHARTGPFTILEGNHRLVALAEAKPAQQMAIKMVAYAGVSSRPCEWHRPVSRALSRVGVGERQLAQRLLRAADAALYRSKNDGRNRVTATTLEGKALRAAAK